MNFYVDGLLISISTVVLPFAKVSQIMHKLFCCTYLLPYHSDNTFSTVFMRFNSERHHFKGLAIDLSLPVSFFVCSALFFYVLRCGRF